MAYAYSNNGLSFRAWDQPNSLQAGEVYFDHAPSEQEVSDAFPGYAAAAAAGAVPAVLLAKLRAGLAVTSTGTPDLNATYALDDTSQSQLNNVATFAQVWGVFPNGQATMAYPDATGVPRTLTATLARDLLLAVAAYVTSLQTAAAILEAGGPADWPAAAATIA